MRVGSPTQESHAGHVGVFLGCKAAHRTFADAVFARSTFERASASGRDPDAADLDCLSACLDKFPPRCRESSSHKEKEHRARKSAAEHNRLGEALHTGTCEQSESAALPLSRRWPVGLLAHEGRRSRLRPRPLRDLLADQGPGPRDACWLTLEPNAGHIGGSWARSTHRASRERLMRSTHLSRIMPVPRLDPGRA